MCTHIEKERPQERRFNFKFFFFVALREGKANEDDSEKEKGAVCTWNRDIKLWRVIDLACIEMGETKDR